MVKLLLTKAPILVPPTNGESLLLYIAATTQVVSAVLVAEWEEEGHALKVQCPVYFISEVLSNSKTRYSQIQKLVHRPHHQEEAMPLLRVTPYDSHNVVPPRRGRP